MKRKAIGGGVYEELNAKGRATKRYWLRPIVNKRLTWNLLKADNRTDAHKEAADRDFAPSGETFAGVAALYLKTGCQTKKRKWKAANGGYQKESATHVRQLKGFYGNWKIGDINLASIQKYFTWRTHGLKECNWPTRQAEKEIQTLSNILNYAVFITEQIEVNKIHSNRPTFHTVKSLARQRAPINADIIHRIAEEFFKSTRSEVFGWMTYFGMLTGCRISELLRLRLDAEPKMPGHITSHPEKPVPEHKAIYISVGAIDLGRRSKQTDSDGDGVKPECDLWPEFKDMLDCFLYWHEERFPDSPFYFPGMSGVLPVDLGSWNHALMRVCARMPGAPHITPHGFRSYFTTKLIRDGFRYEDVAERIGDKTVALLKTRYSKRASDERLHWLPTEGLPGWKRWQPASQKITALKQSVAANK